MEVRVSPSLSVRISPAAEALLARLRDEVEYTEEIDGEVWGVVYLDNVRTKEVPPHQFAGYLSALEAAKLYQTIVGREFAGIFGKVKIL